MLFSSFIVTVIIFARSLSENGSDYSDAYSYYNDDTYSYDHYHESKHYYSTSTNLVSTTTPYNGIGIIKNILSLIKR